MVIEKEKQRLQNAIQYFQQGDIDSSENALNSIIKHQKNIPLTWFLLATIHLQKGQFDNSVKEYKNAIKLQPNYPDAYNNLGVAYEALKNITNAETAYKKAIEQKPGYASALFNLGNIKQNARDYTSAIELYKKALHQDPHYVKALNNLALIYQNQQLYNEAINYYRQAMTISPRDSDIYNNLGHCYYCIGDYQKAIQYYQNGISISPDKPQIHNNIAIAFQSINENEKSIEHYNIALSLDEKYIEALTNLANVYKMKSDVSRAEHYYQKALSLDPNYEEANNNYGLLLYNRKEYTKASTFFKKAINSNPDFLEARYNFSTYSLARGDFVEGWRNYYARPTVRNNLAIDPQHLSIDLLKDKTILLLAEQGIGDELFFLRFAPQLARIAKKIDIQTSQKISFCVNQLPYIDNVYIGDISKITNQYDYCLSIGDLPSLLVTDNQNIPKTIKLSASQNDLKSIRLILNSFGPPPYFAFTWQGGQKIKNFLHKNISLKDLWGVLDKLPGTLIDIQRNPTDEEISDLKVLSQDRKIANLAELNEDLPKMLALLSIVDSYIGVSNTNMHLRHSLGKSAHVLIPHPPEWRWMFENNSPWFPGFSTFRQSADNNWEVALNTLMEDFKKTYGY